MKRKKKKWTILRKKVERFEFKAKGEKFHFACCDCGLVHNIAIALEKNGMQVKKWHYPS